LGNQSALRKGRGMGREGGKWRGKGKNEEGRGGREERYK
jgi:hypothetical protein